MFRKQKYILLLLMLILHLNSGASVTKSEIDFIHYTIKDGLSQGTVLAIYQDKYSFLWLGTRDGLNRFDGYDFKVFRQIPGDTTSIGGNNINDITGDKDGNLWIATSNGLSFFDKLNAKFTNYKIPSYKKDAEVSDVMIDENNVIWVGTKDGLFLLNTSSGEFHQPIQHPILREIGSNYVLSVLEDSKHNIWVGTTNGIYFQNNKSGNVTWYHPEQKGKNHLNHARIEKIIEDSSGIIWAGSYGGGLQCIDPQKGFLFSLNSSSGKKNALSNDFIRDLFLDDKNRVWIGTFDGLNIYDINEDSTIRVHYDPDKSIGLSHNSVRSIYGLSDGSICIGTYFGGLNYYNTYNQKFIYLQNIPEDPTSLSYNVVSSFAKKDSMHVWIGTERGGLNLLSLKDYSFVKFPFNQGANSLSSHTIKSLYNDDAGLLWVGTFKEGLNLYDPALNSFSRFPSASNPGYEYLSNSIVNDIMEDRDGFLWIATDRHGGLHKFDIDKQEFTRFNLMDSIHHVLENTNVKSLMLDKFGNIWLSTHGKGVIVFNEKEGYLLEIGTSTSNLFNISYNDVNQVFEDNEGKIWIATNGGGINILERQNNNVTMITTRDGLLSNMVLGVSQDKEGYIWITSASGMTKYSPDSGSFKNYSYNSGMPLEEINTHPRFFSETDYLFVGGNNGMIFFHPSEMEDNQAVPQVKITDFRLFNKSVLPGDDTKILTKNILDTDRIILDHSQSIFTIEFTSITFLYPQESIYKYMLEGLETGWNEVKNQRIATYTSLKEGSYRFLVMGTNNDGIWNKEPEVLDIIILPPLWKTWWASLIYLILIALGILGLRQMIIKRARLKNDLKMKEMENQKLEEIHKIKLQFFTDVSHEILTPLTLIVDPLEQVMESDHDAKKQKNLLQTIHQNTRRLLLLINQILELNQIENGKLKLNFEKVNLSKLLKEIVDSFLLLADKSNIQLNFISTIPDNFLSIDKDKFEKIFYNLLSNAFKFNKPGGIVDVMAQVSPNPKEGHIAIEFIVRDTGRGIEKEKLDRIFDRFYKADDSVRGSGVGLSLVKSLVEAMGGEIFVRSEKFLGSTFTIKLEFEETLSDEIKENTLSSDFIRSLTLENYHHLDEEESIFPVNQQGKSSVVIIEDDPELLQYLKSNLSTGFEVITAKDGITGKELINIYNPDLVITDIMIPGIDGTELCRSIKSDIKTSHIPVIILTAKTGDEERLKGLESGADAFLVKPFIMRELNSRINNILYTRDKLRERYSKEIHLSPSDITLNSYDDQLLEKILKVIEKHMSEPSLTVDFLGEKVGLSRVHLYRKLKALTNLSPSEFIKSMRMKRAANLLSKNKINVSEVGYRVGFQDLNYFSKTFKKFYGYSPSDYAELKKEKPASDL